jgi:hypothetical protein
MQAMRETTSAPSLAGSFRESTAQRPPPPSSRKKMISGSHRDHVCSPSLRVTVTTVTVPGTVVDGASLSAREPLIVRASSPSHLIRHSGWHSPIVGTCFRGLHDSPSSVRVRVATGSWAATGKRNAASDRHLVPQWQSRWHSAQWQAPGLPSSFDFALVLSLSYFNSSHWHGIIMMSESDFHGCRPPSRCQPE